MWSVPFLYSHCKRKRHGINVDGHPVSPHPTKVFICDEHRSASASVPDQNLQKHILSSAATPHPRNPLFAAPPSIISSQLTEPSTVSWTWNGSHPSGTAAEVKAGDVTVTSHRGNDITKTGTQDNPAVHIERSGNDVVKTVSELKVEQKGASQKEDGTWDNSNSASSSEKKEEPKKDEEKKENGVNGDEAQAGDKRKAEEKVDASAKETEKPAEEKDTKKQKTTNGTAANGETKKKAGRPKGGNSTKKEKAPPRTGTAARKTRSQGKAD
jgi:hypothetical protein